MEYMISNGVKFGYEGVSRTFTKHKTYFLAETKKNLKLHNDYGKLIGIK